MRNAKVGTTGYPRATPIGPGMRILFGVLGLAALIPVVLIAMNEFGALSDGARGGPLVMLAFCVVVFLGSLTLLRASLRGVAMVRRPRR